MKSTILRITALLLMLLMLVGCSTADSGSNAEAPSEAEPSGNTSPEPDPKPEPDPIPEPVASNVLSDDDLSYVMIYNPQIYNENTSFRMSDLSTGTLGSQIDTSAFRADEEPLEFDFYANPTPGDMMEMFPLDELEPEVSRADVTITPYSVGDTRDFYAIDRYDQPVQLSFTCGYAGEYCNVWTADSTMSAVYVEEYGTEFDENIYEQAVEKFGPARFADNGGKVNLLFSSLPDGVGGYFMPASLLSSSNCPPGIAETNYINTDHAIVHINSDMVGNPRFETFIKGTLAHEFQHLICGSSYIDSLLFHESAPGTWFNEAMSGYIEEMIYPGSKVGGGHYFSLYDSARLRNGQSLYNFDNGPDGDVAVYGSVYLFSEYMVDLAGEDVFLKFHDYWRNSYSGDSNDAEALISALPAQVVKEVDAFIQYPDSFSFESEEEALLSKLTLGYHLSLLNIDSSSPDAYQTAIDVIQDTAGSRLLFDDENTLAGCFLYDTIGEATIEGGGRIIVALSDTQFEIPEDADTGLVYIPLDSNFQPIGDPIFG